MAKISALPAAQVLSGNEHIPIVQAGQTRGATMTAFRALITPFLQNWYKGDKGDPGSANSVVASLEELKAAGVSDSCRIWGGVPFSWETEAAPYISDEGQPYVTIVESDHEPLSVGAWKRQGVDRVTFRQTMSSRVRDAASKMSEAPFSPQDFGAPLDASADQTAGFVSCASVAGTVQLSSRYGSRHVFVAPTAETFDDTIIDADPQVTVSIPGLSGDVAKQYSTIAAMQFARPTRVQFRDVGRNMVFPADPNPYAIPQMSPMDGFGRRSLKNIDMYTDVKIQRLSWPDVGDVWQVVTPQLANASSVRISTIPGSFVGAFTSLAVGETVHMMFSDLPASGAVGVFYIGADGMAGQYDAVAADGDKAYNFGKLTGQSPANNQDIDYPNRGVNGTFRFSRSVFSVTRIARDKVSVRINGEPFIRTGVQTGAIGDIQEVGIAFYTADLETSVTCQQFVVEKSDNLFGSINLKGGIVVGGDSTAERMGASTWPDRVPELLEGALGMQVGPIFNFGRVSSTSQEMFGTLIASLPNAGAYIYALCAGTNDIQGLTPRASFTATWENGLDTLLANGRLPFVMIPYIWHGAAEAGGTGYATSNADRGAWYRSEIMRICISRGVRFCDTPAALGNPEPRLRDDPRGGNQLRDNIHQTPGKGHPLYARAFVRMILEHFGTFPRSYSSRFGTGVLKDAAAGPFGIGYEQDHGGRIRLFGYLSVSNVADGATWLELPRHLRPSRVSSFFLPALDENLVSLAPQGRVDINLDGTVKCFGMPTGSKLVGLDTISLLPAPYAIG